MYDTSDREYRNAHLLSTLTFLDQGGSMCMRLPTPDQLELKLNSMERLGLHKPKLKPPRYLVLNKRTRQNRFKRRK